jgi:GT2 family glycosyltransferase
MVDCDIQRSDGPSALAFDIHALREEFTHHSLRERPLCDVLRSAFFPSTWLIRKDVIEAAGYFDPSMRICEDTDVLSRVALQGPFIVNCFAGTRLLRHAGSSGLSNLYEKSRLEYFNNILRTYLHLNSSTNLNPAEKAHVKRELSATYVEIALLHSMAGNVSAFRQSLSSSVAANPTFFSLLKALLLFATGARAYEALRGLRDSRRTVYRRRSAAG